MVRIMMVGSYERKRVGFGGRHRMERLNVLLAIQ